MDFLTNINIEFYLLAYIVGGIPFGLILSKKFAKLDIREEGSKSIGATNVLRVLKEKNPSLAKKIALSTLILDVLKGMGVLILAMFFNVSIETLWAISILAVIGHCYSPFLKFEGGKGVATGMGVLLFMLPIETTIAALVWIIAGKTIKISSVSSLLGLISLIIASFIIHPELDVIKTHAPIILIAIIIIYKHIPNLVRLFSGKEAQVV